MRHPVAILLIVILFAGSFLSEAAAQCTPRSLPFTENFSVTPFAACTPTVGGWVSTSVASGAGWWLPSTNYAGGSVPEAEGYGDQANGGVPETIRLISPPLNTTGASALTLSFRHSLYLHNAAASGPPGIQINVEVSQDSIVWTNVYNASYAATSTLTGVVIELRTVNISGITGNTAYIRFSINGVLFKVWGWEIDNINVAVDISTLVATHMLSDRMIYHDRSSRNILINLAGMQHAGAVLYDILGNTVYDSGIFNERLSIDVGGLSKGIYFVKLQSENGTVTKKIVLD